jgi:hypothetical protein
MPQVAIEEIRKERNAFSRVRSVEPSAGIEMM